MALPAIITKLLPAKNRKPKGEISTLEGQEMVVLQAGQIILLPKELDPTDISTITMKFRTEYGGYHFYKLSDSETGHQDEVLIKKEYTSLLPHEFDEAIRKEKLKFRVASTNLKRNKLI